MQWFYKIMVIITAARTFDLIARGYDYLDQNSLGAVEIAGPSARAWGVAGLIIAGAVTLGLWKNPRLASWSAVAAGAYFSSLSLISLWNTWAFYPDEIRVFGAYAATACVWFVLAVFWNGYTAVQQDRATRG